jgi:type II secretion system protein H
MNPAPSPEGRRGGRAGFTLVELLVVMFIMAIALTVAIPMLREVKRSPLAQATMDFEAACREARSRAILSGRPMQLVIRGGGGELAVEEAPAGVLGATNGVSALSFTEELASQQTAPVFSSRFSDEVGFRSIVVNQRNFMDAAATAVRFYPNGTCDQFEGELQWLRREARRLRLEVMTAMPEVEDIR